MNARKSVMLAVLQASTVALSAQELVIQSFESDGTITFNAVSNATEYAVGKESGGEWTPLATISDTSSGTITATVPMAEVSNLYCVEAMLGSSGDATYLVIDLSGGAEATSYPVSYLSEIPAGGWTEQHRTTELVLRRISAGSFTMGSPPAELGHRADETQHQVTLTRDFYIGVFEVTQEQWYRVLGFWAGYFDNVRYRASRPVERRVWSDIRGNSAGSQWPRSSAVDESSFMGVLRARTGLSELDLPTESQWEYACRAGTTTALNSGKNLTDPSYIDPNMDEVGRYFKNGGWKEQHDVDTSGGTARVGSYLPNPWGLYDMHGNVHELCLDWYGPYPGTAVDPRGALSGQNRVSRGGGILSLPGDCRSGRRYYIAPITFRSGTAGFRVAMTLP